MSFSPYGPWDIVKQLQYNEETNYGAKNTSSPVYISAGAETSIRENSQIRMEEYAQLGSRDIYKLLKFGEIHSLEVRYRPFNTALIRYGTELSNVNKGLTFLTSANQYPSGSAVEMYSFYIGSITDRLRMEVTESSALVTHNFLCKSIPVEASVHGLTTPTFAGADTADPWTGLTGGQLPMVINGVSYDTDRFAIEYTWTPEVIQPNGETTPKWIKQTNRRIKINWDTWVGKNQTLETDMLNFTPRAAAYTLNSTGPKKINMVDLYNFQKEKTLDTAGANHVKARYSAQCVSATVDA